MDKINWAKNACALFLLCAATAIGLPAQTFEFETLHSFDGYPTDGALPTAPLVQDIDGDLYGTTTWGGTSSACGSYGCGTVFKITRRGTLTTLHSFAGYPTDGAHPNAALVQDTDGNLYGTTQDGGANACFGNGCGTVFKITRSGALTTLHSFAGYPTDGGWPGAALVQDRDGDFYGTTEIGGNYRYGTVFKITRSGTLTTLHSFDLTDGSEPAAALAQDRDGDFYGTTVNGGASGYGTVFKITRSGTLTTLHNFDWTDGAGPWAALVRDRDGNFYGTTADGGASSNCPYGCGTVFKITPTGTPTTLYNFCSESGCTDGLVPYAALLQDRDGNFYGTTLSGGTSSACGSYGCGTVFKITRWGTLTTLHSFDYTDGKWPYAALVQDWDGNFYGTTGLGGVSSNCPPAGCGTVFRLSPIRER
jgi:uncharacterized repeat protein (TIGR03803 family)